MRRPKHRSCLSALLSSSLLVSFLGGAPARADDGKNREDSENGFGAASRARPSNAAGALDQAAAAYEFGDLPLVVESARLVAEGELEGTVEQRADAFRFLGIGLFLTGRSGGAEAAFTELLKLRPGAQLDRKTTRPEVVAFFEDVRRRRSEALWKDAMARKWIGWAFVPPVGQFQNGDRAKGWTLLVIEAAAGATALTTWAMLTAWHRPDDQLGEDGEHNDLGRTLKTVNHVSLGVFAAAALYGVVDALACFGRAPAEPAERTSSGPRVRIGPGSLELAVRF